MLDKGRELDWFSSDIIIVCAIVAAIALISLIIWELTAEQPVLDLSVFKSRNWVVSTVTLCLMFGIFFGNIVLTPLWLQQWMGYTATWAGYADGPHGDPGRPELAHNWSSAAEGRSPSAGELWHGGYWRSPL